jgi:predicted anti-sigma-YlaC factor YlaD
MHCDDARTLMDQVLDGAGAADSGRQGALLAHVADCAACGPEWQALKRIHRVLVQAPQVPPPRDFTAQVMASLPRHQPVQHAWAGALALLIGTIGLAVVAMVPFVPVDLTSNPVGLTASVIAIVLQVGEALFGWLQTGWELRRALLAVVPVSLLALYGVFAVVAAAVWLRLVTGIQGVLQPVRK